MTPGAIVRSLLALLFGVAVALLTLTRASVPPESAVDVALGNASGDDTGPVISAPVSTPTTGMPGKTPSSVPTRHPITIKPHIQLASFPKVPGYIFFTGEDHNLYFISGQYAQRRFTGDGQSVSPAVSPDGKHLAWVNFRSSWSDIILTDINYGPGGSMIPMTTTRLTHDQDPPTSLQTSPAPPGVYDPRYWWWANKPSWLPDGRHLLYISDRPGFNPDNPEAATGAVWEQGVTDTITNAIQLTTPVAGTGGHDSPEWRPRDPAVFLYVNYDYTDQQKPEGIIEAAMALTGTAPPTTTIALTPPGHVMYQPAWSPESHSIAFIEDVSNVTAKGHARTDLKIMPYHRPGYPGDYDKAITVVTGHPYVAQPFWSPDGRYLGYLVSDGGPFSIVIRTVKLDGNTFVFGPPIHLPQARLVSAEYRPSWSQP